MKSKVFRIPSISLMPRIVLASSLIFLSDLSSAQPNDWFLTHSANCSGLMSVATAISAIAPLSVNLHSGNSAGNIFASLPVTHFNNLRNSSSDTLSDDKTLDKPQAASLRKILATTGNTVSVPVWLSVPTNVLINFTLPPAAGTVAGLLFSYFTDNLNAVAMSLEAESLLIAEDGRIYHRISLKRDATDHFYLLANTEYGVRVGKESRTVVFYACMYPVQVVVSEFRTTGGMNDKVIKKNGGNWGVWDITDKKWDSRVLKYVGQDGSYYYFDEDAVEYGKVVGTNSHRISLSGGAWQRKRWDGETYQSYYATTSAN